MSVHLSQIVSDGSRVDQVWYNEAAEALGRIPNVGTGGYNVKAASYIVGVINSVHYVWDGSTGKVVFSNDDASVTIQWAANQLTNGGIIFIRQGSYPISAVINILSNTTISGEGRGNTILYRTGATWFPLLQNSDWVAGNTNIIIRDISLDGQRGVDYTTHDGGLIEFVRVTDGLIQSVHCYGGVSYGVEICCCQRVTVTSSFFNDNGEGLTVMDGSYSLLNVAGTHESEGIIVSNNFAWLNHDHGFSACNGPNSVSFIGNTVLSTVGRGCFEVYTDIDNVGPTDILFEGNTALNSGTIDGAFFILGEFPEVSVPDRISYVGNTVIDTDFSGFNLRSANHVTVQANRVDNAPNVGIDLVSCEDSFVSGNYINNVGGGVAPGGIRLELDTTVSVSGNFITNSTIAMRVVNTSDATFIANYVASSCGTSFLDDSGNVNLTVVDPVNPIDLLTKLKLYLPMDENGGATAKDWSGNCRNGTITTAAWAAGKYGYALNFDGANDWVTLPSSVSLVSGDFTICCWVKPDTFTNWGDFYGEGNNGSANPYVQFGTDNTGKLRFTMRDDALAHSVDLKGSVLITTDFTFVVAMRRTNDFATYINGVIDETGTSALGTLTCNTFFLGKLVRNAGDSQLYDGTLDDFKIYGRALSLTEINSIYASGPLPHSS